MIITLFLEQVQKYPQKNALIVGDQILTYSQLSQHVAALSKEFEARGVQEGTSIVLLLKNSADFVITMLAAAHRGAVIVPLNPTLKTEAIQKAMQASDAKFVMGTTAVLESLTASGVLSSKQGFSISEEAKEFISVRRVLENPYGQSLEPRTVDKHADFILTMTSGSTGEPKPIVFTQATKITRAMSARDCYRLDHSIVSIAATPLYHSLAQRLTFLPLLLGGTAVVMPHFTPHLWLEAVSKHRGTFSIPVSSQLIGILREAHEKQHDLSSLRILVSSSAAISKEAKDQLNAHFSHCEIHEIYGASEVGVITNLAPKDGEDKRGTVGKALPGIDLRVVDENDKSVGVGEIGEITCKTPTAFKGYYKLPDVTAKAMRGGYFHTGDLGRLDQEGFLTFVGRSKDIIITGGINVYPEDIEKALMQSELLQECAVIGVDDVQLGEAVLAVVVPKHPETFSVRELQKLCVKKLADYQQPLGFEIVPALPRNSLGKISKPTLREQFRHLDLTKNIRAILKK